MQTAAAVAAQGPLISHSPSFNAYSSSDRLAQIAARVVSELTLHDKQLAQESDWENLYGYREEEVQKQQQQPQDGGGTEAAAEEEEEEEEFEFAVVPREPYTCPISADEIFANGQIRPVYPLFNQDLLLLDQHNDVVSSTNSIVNNDVTDSVTNAKNTAPKQRRLPLRMLMIEEERETASCSSSEADDLENLPPGTYCVWAPPKSSSGRRAGSKSGSAGWSKRWKFRDLLYRSSSGGKNTFVILAPSVVAKKGDDINMKGDDVARKRVGGDGDGAEAREKRRSILPVKQDFVGFFSNVNGLSRNLHPF